jgi:hypothetical protein
MRPLIRTSTARTFWKTVAAALALAACGGNGARTSGTSTSSGGNACVPGAQVACACPGGGKQGVRVCTPDGSGLGACDGCGAASGADAGPSCPESAQKLYYHDADGDSYGGTDTQMACEPPGPDWVLQGGDCDDADPQVHPGQTAYFGQPYGVGGSVSFDYNCDGQETQDPGAGPALPPDPTCTGNPLQGPCSGPNGYWPTARTGAGVDPYCGSTKYGYCEAEYDSEFNTWACETSNDTTMPAMGCH